MGLEDKERLIRIIRMAEANVRIDNLPLSDEFVEEYIKREIERLENNEKTLKRCKDE